MNKEFLLELLRTPSPSGEEYIIQKKWREHIGQYAHTTKTDNAGNVYAFLNPENEFKVMLAAHSDEIGFIVRKIDKEGYIYLEKAGGISPVPALGMRVKIGRKVSGVVGVNAEHHQGEKRDIDIKKIFVDCGFRDKAHAMEYVAVGDMVIYDSEPSELLEDKLVSKALDNKSGLFIMTEIIRRLSNEELSIGVVGVSTVNEETNMGGAYFAGSQVNPDMAIALDVTFAGDYPKAEDIDVKLGKGPVIAKGAPINRRINEHLERTAKSLDIDIQYELTPRNTGTDADIIRKTGKGVPVALISLPLRYMHSPNEVCSLRDVETEIDLLVEAIKGVRPDFNLCPID